MQTLFMRHNNYKYKFVIAVDMLKLCTNVFEISIFYRLFIINKT